MNREEVVKNMVTFIEKEERNLQASKMTNDSKAKTDVVNRILEELEREVNNEN